MRRLIDADALKERAIRVSTVKDRCYMKAVGTHEIDKAPTVDAVPVVRCKDCKHRVEAKYGYRCGNLYYGMAAGVNLKNYDFCSYGERKEK